MAKEIALFDGDGTLHEGFSIFGVYDACHAAGLISRIDNELLSGLVASYEAGEIDYLRLVASTQQMGAYALKGQSAEAATKIATEFYTDKTFKWFGYVRPLLEEMDENQVETVLITAGPQFVASGIATALDFRNSYSTVFPVEDGNFVGQVDPRTVLGSPQKGLRARRLKHGTDRSWAFGDSEGDIGMLSEVKHAVCIRPTEGLRTHALTKGWVVIDNPDQPLTDLLA